MKVRRLFPRDVEEGHYLESVAIFAARRCRTVKDYDALWLEVAGYSEERRGNFLGKVVFTDWAADVLEMQHLIYDWEDVPVWLIIELLRHRMIAREFSLEQLSQRAISPAKLRVEAPHPRLQALVDRYVKLVVRIADEKHIPPEQLREVFPQGVLVNLVIGGNLRAFHHFFFMRSSELYQGKGGAHPKFMWLADRMQEQATEVYRDTMKQILKA